MKKKKAAESEEVIKRPKTENKILVKKEAGLAEQFPVKYLPLKVFALYKAAGVDSERPELRVVRIEPQKAMATDGHVLLTIIPAEKFSVDKVFTVDAEMCAQIIKAKGLSGEDATIQLSDGVGQPVITVGNYRFSPSAQLELFEYESVLEQKTAPVGKISLGVAVMDKLLRSLRAVGVNHFTLEIAGEMDPVKVSAKVDGLDLVTGAIMPMRM
mgnify:CR=1 FL=1